MTRPRVLPVMLFALLSGALVPAISLAGSGAEAPAEGLVAFHHFTRDAHGWTTVPAGAGGLERGQGYLEIPRPDDGFAARSPGFEVQVGDRLSWTFSSPGDVRPVLEFRAQDGTLLLEVRLGGWAWIGSQTPEGWQEGVWSEDCWWREPVVELVLLEDAVRVVDLCRRTDEVTALGVTSVSWVQLSSGSFYDNLRLESFRLERGEAGFHVDFSTHTVAEAGGTLVAAGQGEVYEDANKASPIGRPGWLEVEGSGAAEAVAYAELPASSLDQRFLVETVLSERGYLLRPVQHHALLAGIADDAGTADVRWAVTIADERLWDPTAYPNDGWGVFFVDSDGRMLRLGDWRGGYDGAFWIVADPADGTLEVYADVLRDPVALGSVHDVAFDDVTRYGLGDVFPDGCLPHVPTDDTCDAVYLQTVLGLPPPGEGRSRFYHASARPFAGSPITDPVPPALELPPFVDARLDDDARARVIAVSATGDAACDGEGCLAAAPQGEATAGQIAASAGGGAACSSSWCWAITGTGDARCQGANCIAASGSGDTSCPQRPSYYGCFAVSGTGDANGTTPLSATGTCNGRACAAVQPGDDAEGTYLAVSGTGDASCGGSASVRLFVVTDDCLAVSATGNATGGLAVSAAGDATGEPAVSGAGDASGYASVSVLGCAEGVSSIDLCDSFVATPEGDAEGSWLAATGSGNASCTQAYCVAISGDGDARCDGSACAVVSNSGNATCTGTLCTAVSRGGHASGGTWVELGSQDGCDEDADWCVSRSVAGDPSCQGQVACAAVSGTGNTTCTSPSCIAVSGTGDASCTGASRCVAATGTGEATCEGETCLATSPGQGTLCARSAVTERQCLDAYLPGPGWAPPVTPNRGPGVG